MKPSHCHDLDRVVCAPTSLIVSEVLLRLSLCRRVGRTLPDLRATTTALLRLRRDCHTDGVDRVDGKLLLLQSPGGHALRVAPGRCGVAALRSTFVGGICQSNPRHWRWPSWITTPLAAVVLLVTDNDAGVVHFREPIPWPSPMASLFRIVAPLRSFNGYGLFAMMTAATRPEIIIEGSNLDSQTWSAYEFKYKPGRPDPPPPAFVAPHQPRLDWQMWF